MADDICTTPSKFSNDQVYQTRCAGLSKELKNYYQGFDKAFNQQKTAFNSSIVLRDALPDPRDTFNNSSFVGSYYSNSTNTLNLFSETIYRFGPSHFRHETFHSWMRNLLGKDQFAQIPKWFKEGSAVYGSDEIKEKLEEYLSKYPSTLPFPSLNDKNSSSTDIKYYSQYALAVEFIDKKYAGPQGIKKLLSHLKKGEKFEDALLKIASKKPASLEDFYQQASAYASQKISSYHQSETQNFFKIVENFSPKFNAYFLKGEGLPLPPLMAQISKPSENLTAFKRSLKAYQGKLFDSFKNMLLGLICLQQGDYSEAVSNFQKEIRKKIPSTYSHLAYYYYGLSVYMLNPEKNKDEATKALQHALNISLSPNRNVVIARQLDAISKNQLNPKNWIF